MLLGRLFFRLIVRAGEKPLLTEDELLAEARIEGPICYGVAGDPHSPVPMRAESADVDMTTMSVAMLAERSDVFVCPVCRRHPTIQDWVDFLQHRWETEGY